MGCAKSQPMSFDDDDDWSVKVDRQLLLPFPYKVAAKPLVLDKAWLSDFLRNMEPRAAKAANSAIQHFNALGIKVFSAGTKVGVTPTEADYGAPSIGLEFFGQILDPKRAFRYEPVKFIDEDNRTHVPQAHAIGAAMAKAGYALFKDKHMGDHASLIHFANGGVTRGFSDVMDMAIADFEDTQRLRAACGKEQRGVILMPMPTYGLFVNRLQDVIAGKNIRIAAVRRQDSGAVDLHSLHTQIKECELYGEKIIAFYESNPNNPSGYIRERAETKQIGEMLKDANYRQINEDMQILQENDKMLSTVIDKNKLIGVRLNLDMTPKGSLLIIDDMAYEGLEIKKGKKPFSFGQGSKEIAEMSVVLKGISKIGMPGMRIAMVMAHPVLISDLTSAQFMREFCANSLGVDIIAARYGAKQDRAIFRAHEKRLRERHGRAVERVQVFFKGIDNVPTLSGKHRAEIIRDYAGHAGIDAASSERILKQGLPNLQINNGPESGFFQCVNCEALKNRPVAIQFENNRVPGYVPINSSTMLYWVFKAFDINAIPASYMGASEKNMTMRITYSLPDKDMFVLYDRLRVMHEHFWGDAPEVQFDLFHGSNAASPKLAI